jgi:hypothetical protein
MRKSRLSVIARGPPAEAEVDQQRGRRVEGHRRVLGRAVGEHGRAAQRPVAAAGLVQPGLAVGGGEPAQRDAIEVRPTGEVLGVGLELEAIACAPRPDGTAPSRSARSAAAPAPRGVIAVAGAARSGPDPCAWCQHHRVAVDGDVVDPGQEPAGGGVLDPGQGRRDVGRAEGGAVVEVRAGPDRDVALAVDHLGQRRGQVGRDPTVGADPVQGVEDQRDHRDVGRGPRRHRIEAGRLAEQRAGDDAAVARPPLAVDGRAASASAGRARPGPAAASVEQPQIHLAAPTRRTAAKASRSPSPSTSPTASATTPPRKPRRNTGLGATPRSVSAPHHDRVAVAGRAGAGDQDLERAVAIDVVELDRGPDRSRIAVVVGGQAGRRADAAGLDR